MCSSHQLYISIPLLSFKNSNEMFSIFPGFPHVRTYGGPICSIRSRHSGQLEFRLYVLPTWQYVCSTCMSEFCLVESLLPFWLNAQIFFLKIWHCGSKVCVRMGDSPCTGRKNIKDVGWIHGHVDNKFEQQLGISPFEADTRTT